jgi:hypothetical protein
VGIGGFLGRAVKGPPVACEAPSGLLPGGRTPPGWVHRELASLRPLRCERERGSLRLELRVTGSCWQLLSCCSAAACQGAWISAALEGRPQRALGLEQQAMSLQARKSPIPVPPTPDLAGKRGTRREPPIPDSAGLGIGNREIGPALSPSPPFPDWPQIGTRNFKWKSARGDTLRV